MPLTTIALPIFLHTAESFRPLAYDDLNPDKVLQPGDEVEGTLTYGHGLTKRPDGSDLQIGDTITEQESFDRVYKYIREEVEPWLEDILHVQLSPFQYDALGSLIYNFGGDAIARWKLIRKINSGAEPEDIAREWMDRTYFSKGRALLGLYRRRMKEVLKFFKLEYRAAANVDWDDDVIDVMYSIGWDGKLPDPDPIKPVESPPTQPVEPEMDDTYEGYRDPTPESEWTTADYNEIQRRKLAGIKPVAITAVTKKVPLQAVDYLSDEAKKEPTVKRVRDSQRGKGDIKQATGEKMAILGAAGSAGTAVGAMEPIVSFFNKYPKEAIAWGFAGMILVGLVVYMLGKWQRQKGEDEAEDVLG